MEKAKEIIENIRYITIATASKECEPWNTPVYAIHDENYNFYWVSWFGTQHSKNIVENSSIFIVIYDSTVPEGAGAGVYIKAKGYELSDRMEIEQAAARLYAGKNKTPRPVGEFLGEHPRRIYKAVPEKVWQNLDVEKKGKIVDTRQEITLV